MSSLVVSNTAVKDGNGSVVVAGTCTDGTRTFAATGVVGDDGVHFQPSMDSASRPGYAVQVIAGAAVSTGNPVPVALTSAQIATLTPAAAISGFALEAGHLASIDTFTGAIGARTDAKSAATDATDASAISVLKQISASAQAPPSREVTNAGTFPVQASGDVADGDADGGSPVKMGSRYDATLPTYADGQRTTIHTDERGVLFTRDAYGLNVIDDQAGVQPQDVEATTGSITAADVATTSVTNSAGQTVITGTPTPGSFVHVPLNGQTCVTIQISGVNSNTFVFDRSVDDGETYIPASPELLSVGTEVSSLAVSDDKAYVLRLSAAGLTDLRVRSTVHTSGTAEVLAQPGFGVANVPVSLVGGVRPYHLPSSAGSTNAANVKNAAGTLYRGRALNTAAYTVFIKFFDTPVTPVPGTDPVYDVVAVPPAVGGVPGEAVWNSPLGDAYPNGLSYALTKQVADNDATAVLAGDVVALSLGYK